ncbi:MAG: LolA-related protein [Myxococcota bacterium]|nr:LolA-related protein [Myxococcota bacterium]
MAAIFVTGWAIESPAEDTIQPAASPTPGVQLEWLMDRLASRPGMRVAFRESRHLAVLSDPIHSEGLMFFSPPGDLARYTLRPVRSSVIVRGDRVFLEDATGSQSFDLASSDVARGLVGIFGVLLRGDLAELRRRYVLDFRGSGDSWALELRPRSRTLQHIIERIEVKGRGAELTRMATFEANGDRTVLVFEDAIPLSEVEGADRNRIFHPDFTGSLP